MVSECFYDPCMHDGHETSHTIHDWEGAAGKRGGAGGRQPPRVTTYSVLPPMVLTIPHTCMACCDGIWILESTVADSRTNLLCDIDTPLGCLLRIACINRLDKYRACRECFIADPQTRVSQN